MPSSFSRRTFVGSSTAAIAALLGGALMPGTAFAGVGSLTAPELIDRRRKFLTGSDLLKALATQSPAPAYKADIDAKVAQLSANAAAHLSSMVMTAGRIVLWNDITLNVKDLARRVSNLWEHFSRLRFLALA